MTHWIDGRALARGLRETIAQKVAQLAESSLRPGLAVILVGEDPASQVYVRNKARQTREAGMVSREYRLPANSSEKELLDLIGQLNTDPAIHGILCQLPLPPPLSETLVIENIAPEKDVDGFHPLNVAHLSTGRTDGMIPCTPYGCLMLLRHFLGNFSGAHAVVMGRSNIVGRPMASLLLSQDATVTVVHSKTRDLTDICRQADILVAAVGRPAFVKSSMVKPGACVIDVGINRVRHPETDKYVLRGDVDADEVSSVAGGLTPVPGGVGPMTIAVLLYNTLRATCRVHQLDLDLDLVLQEL